MRVMRTLTAFTSRSSLSTFTAEVEGLSLGKGSDEGASKQFGALTSRPLLTGGLTSKLEACELQ